MLLWLQMFDPWSVPDSFTVYNFAPDYVNLRLIITLVYYQLVIIMFIPIIRLNLYCTTTGRRRRRSTPFGLISSAYTILSWVIWLGFTKKVPQSIFKLIDRIFIGSMAIMGNTMVLRIFSRYQSLRTPSNMLLINLAVSDLMLMITLIPEAVINFFSGGPWQFGGIYIFLFEWFITIFLW